MSDLRYLKKYSFQPKYSFVLYVPSDLLISFLNRLNIPVNTIVSNIPVIGEFLSMINLDDRLKDLNFLCKSVSEITNVKYDYKSIKFLKNNVMKLSDTSYENNLTINFYCDDNFILYKFISYWCDFVEALSSLSSILNLKFNIRGLYDNCFYCILTLYKIDCKTPSKSFRFWGLAPKEKPAVEEVNRDTTDLFGGFKVDFVYNNIERML